MLTVDGRCFCSRCEKRTKNMYRMVGRCGNCGTEPILVLYRKGDPVTPVDCPVCGNYRRVRTTRLATAEEIPAS